MGRGGNHKIFNIYYDEKIYKTLPNFSLKNKKEEEGSREEENRQI